MRGVAISDTYLAKGKGTEALYIYYLFDHYTFDLEKTKPIFDALCTLGDEAFDEVMVTLPMQNRLSRINKEVNPIFEEIFGEDWRIRVPGLFLIDMPLANFRSGSDYKYVYINLSSYVDDLNKLSSLMRFIGKCSIDKSPIFVVSSLDAKSAPASVLSRASCKIHRTRRIFPVFAGAERPALRPARA